MHGVPYAHDLLSCAFDPFMQCGYLNVKSQLHDACYAVPVYCHLAVDIAGQAENIVLVLQWCHVTCRAARVSMTERFAPPVVAQQIIAEFQRTERDERDVDVLNLLVPQCDL